MFTSIGRFLNILLTLLIVFDLITRPSQKRFIGGAAVTNGIETDDTSSYLTVTASQDAGSTVNVRCSEEATGLSRLARFTVIGRC